MICKVCGADGAEPHFGGESCRACAAFFRRYMHSHKGTTSCTCEYRLPSSHPCRTCRVQKCIETGMCKSKVQRNREKNRVRSFYPGFVPTVSSLPAKVIPRSCDNLTKTVEKWVDLDRRRKEIQGDSFFDQNITQISETAMDNINLLWEFGASIFPDILKMTSHDKKAVTNNFFLKWLVMESAIDYSTNYEQFRKFLGTEEYYRKCAFFYGSAMPEEKRLKDSETIRIFSPFWDWHYSLVAHPVYLKKCDKVEYMAIFMLLLFDEAYANFSEEGSKLCRNLRKVILRELKGYQIDHNCSETRLVEVVEILLFLEKAEEKLQEEFILSGLHNVRINDDYRKMFQTKKL